MRLDSYDDIAEFLERDVRITCYDGDVIEGWLADLELEDFGEVMREPYISGYWTNVYPGLALRGSEIEKIELLENVDKK